MGSPGLHASIETMRDAGVDETAIRAFAHYYRLLEAGETGLIPEDEIEPVDIPFLSDQPHDDEHGVEALATTAVIKLNGGLGTSMGMDRAKSLLCVRGGLSFLDLIARQVLHLREKYQVRLPLIFMNSFRTSADTLAALERYHDLPVTGLPMELRQNQEPRLLLDGLTPVRWPQDPELEWCPPGHGDLYTALWGSGLLDKLIDAGFERVFVSNSDNLGATATPRLADWFESSGAPFAIEATNRTHSDRKGGHFARRRSDGRIVLRETAQTRPEDYAALQDLSRHRYMSTNNLWFDLRAMRAALQVHDGVLGLPLIRNVKPVDPHDPGSPKVVQIETAMGAAIELFDGAQLIEVDRDRFIPVKTTNDLLVVRSDVYALDEGFRPRQVAASIPFIELDDDHYKLIPDFEQRFAEGAPSLREATSLRVDGDVTFSEGVRVQGDVKVSTDAATRIPADTLLT